MQHFNKIIGDLGVFGQNQLYLLVREHADKHFFAFFCCRHGVSFC